MTDILIGIGALQAAIVEILGRADERGEGAVVERVREGIVRIQRENLLESFGDLQSKAVVNGIAGVVRVIEQAGVGIGRRATGIESVVEEGLSRGPTRRRSFRRRTVRSAGSDAGNGGAGGSAEWRTDVEIFGANQMVRGNPEIACADGKPVGKLAVYFEVGLLGVRDFAVVLDHASACGAGRRARTGNVLVRHLAGGD